MTEMQNLVDRLQDGYRDKSIIKDLKQEGGSNVFSEDSKRKLKQMGNIELYALSETVRSYLLEAFQRRDSLLRMRKVLDTLSRT